MNITPDGVRYIAASQQRVARPFHYRWLLPKIYGDSEHAWDRQRFVIIPLLCLLGGAYTRNWFGLVAPLGLAGVVRFNWHHPLLVDATAMATSLAAAVCWREGWYVPAVLLVLVAACVKETSPVFAALYAWTPWLLVGLVAVGVRHLQHAGPDVLDEQNRQILAHPFRASRQFHDPSRVPVWVWVLPWGACLAGLAHPTAAVAVTVLVAYGQCVVATDTVRLYEWAWPVLALNCVAVVPSKWLLPLALLHVVNPYATQGG